jgi:DNA mismatch repair protein MutS2
MNEHTLRVLEYHKVTGIVAGYAASGPGKAAVLSLLPSTEGELVTTRLQETRECTWLLQCGERPPLDGVADIKPAIQRLGVSGSMLSPAELLGVAQTLGVGRRVKQFFRQFEGAGTPSRPSTPLLCGMATAIQPLKLVEDAVDSAIDEKAEVKDSASPDLRRIRKQITRTREDILGRMSDILQDSGFQKVIQEPVITIREDRYVLPLKPNFKQSLKGVVHGQSGSRSTLFVEPLDVLEQNNRLAELRMDEREEVERILRDITSLMAQHLVEISATCEALTGIDAIYARARFGTEFNGVVPILSLDGGIRLRAARHPLLVDKFRNASPGRSVTPNDIELSTPERTLILSGPNAGGKTVILKTVGLLILMVQSGLPITAAEGSEFPVFKAVYADIGDEQSLEQDLSTFSSHVSRIAEILHSAEKDSLVLLDELGTGTDPGEGAALGAAVLDGLIKLGAATLITTHHNALKLFGSQTSGAVNAAMEFDLQTLKPTYRLLTGRPGRSYGLDMAIRLGVPEDTIRNARERLSEDDTKLDDLLRQVENELHQLVGIRESLKQKLNEAIHDRSDASTLLTAAQEEASTITAKAKQESREVVAALRQKLRELSRMEEHDRAELRKMSADVESLAGKLNPAVRVEHASEHAYAFHAGDRVRILRMNKAGTVLAAQRGVLQVEVGGKTIKLPSNEVALAGPLQENRNVRIAPGWGADFHDEEGAPDQLNILGYRVEDGLAEVDRFIGHAYSRGFSFVTVIHGLGTGALKKAVTEFLKDHPLIASTRPGEAAEGGAGVMVAELKK